MIWEQLALWQKITLYGLTLIGLFIYVKLTKLRFHGKPLISLKYRIALALFFPVIAVLLFFFGMLFLGIAALAIIGILAYTLITKKRFKMPGIRIVIKKGLPK